MLCFVAFAYATTCWWIEIFIYPHNMMNFGPLTAEICWRVWGTPTNFDGFRILPSLLHRRRSTEVNQTLHDVWPSPGLGWYIMYTFWGLLPLTEFCQVQNSLCVQIVRSPILVALLHGTRPLGVSQILWRSAEVATDSRQGDHNVGHRPTF